MDFRDLAEREMAGLAERLFSRSEQSVRELQTFRKSLGEAGKLVDSALAHLGQIDRDQQIKAFLDRMTAAAGLAVDEAKARAQADIQQHEARSTALEGRMRQLETTAGELKSHLDKRTSENKTLGVALAEARGQVESLSGALEAEKGRAESARAEGAKALAARNQNDAALRDARAALEQATTARNAVEAKLREAQAGVDAQAKAKSAVEAKLGELQARMDGSLSEIAKARDELAREVAERRRLAGELDAERGGAENRASAPLDRLLDVLQDITSGTTVSDVLTGLARAMSGDFQRVALFNVKGSRIEGVYQSGFDFASDISKVAMPLSGDSLIGQALTTNLVELRSGAEAGTKPPFGGQAACSLAMPIRVHGEALAVIYADSTTATNASPRLKFAELLRRYAIPRLEALSAELKVLAELRAYATLLLDEVEYMYSADVGAGKKDNELQHRLHDNLQCARQIYSQRVAKEGPAAAQLLEERLQVVLDGRKKTPFGRDLKAVIAQAARQPSAAGGAA
jgi:hypothetical protein